MWLLTKHVELRDQNWNMCEMYFHYHPTNQSKVRLLVHDCVFLRGDQTRYSSTSRRPNQTKSRFCALYARDARLNHTSISFQLSTQSDCMQQKFSVFFFQWIDQNTTQCSVWWSERNLNIHICWLTVANPRFQEVSTRCLLWHVFVGNLHCYPLLGLGSWHPQIIWFFKFILSAVTQEISMTWSTTGGSTAADYSLQKWRLSPGLLMEFLQNPDMRDKTSSIYSYIIINICIYIYIYIVSAPTKTYQSHFLMVTVYIWQ